MYLLLYIIITYELNIQKVKELETTSLNFDLKISKLKVFQQLTKTYSEKEYNSHLKTKSYCRHRKLLK